MKKLITLLLFAVGFVGTANAEDKYVVAGSFELLGVDFDTTSSDFTMSTNDGTNYTLSITTFLYAKSNDSDKRYRFKIVKNGSWDTSWPSDDWVIRVDNPGVYNVTFTFNSSNNEVGCSTTQKTSGSALFLRGNMIPGDNSSWNYDYPQFRFIDGSLTLDASSITSDIEFKFKWTDSDTWGGVEKGYAVSQGVVADQTFGYDNNYGNISIPQSTLMCDHYIISVNTTNTTFSVQGYKKVTTNASGYCTYVAPVALTIEGATAYYATDKKNGSAAAHAITNPAANTPLLIKGEARTSTSYSFKVAASGTTINDNAFKAGPVTGLTSGTGPYNYILNGDAFYAANGKNVAEGKAYLQLSQPASARGALVFDNEETGIDVITATADKADACYNLNGQRIAAPSKGLYISNGRKVIMK